MPWKWRMVRHKREVKGMVRSVGKWVKRMGEAVGQVCRCVRRCHSIGTAVKKCNIGTK